MPHTQFSLKNLQRKVKSCLFNTGSPIFIKVAAWILAVSPELCHRLALQLPGSHNHIHGIAFAEDENILAQEELNPELGKQTVLFGGNIHYCIRRKVR